MLFPDRFLGQVELLPHPEAEASEEAEVADLPEVVERLLRFLPPQQELLEVLPEMLQSGLLLQQRPEEVAQELPIQSVKLLVQLVNLLQPVEQPVHPQEQKQTQMLPQKRNLMLL